MRQSHWLIAAAGLVTVLAAAPARAQGGQSPYDALRQYDFQDRRPLDEIAKAATAARGDRAQRAAIEASLVGVLQDPNATFAGKQEAARLLWMVGTKNSVPALAKLLGDEKLNHAARYALERIQDPAAGAALRAALPKSTGQQRIGIINSLGHRGDVLAVSLIRPLAAKGDALTMDASITALGKIGTPAALTVLRTLPAGSQTVQTAMLNTAEKMAAGNTRPEALKLYEALAGASYTPVTRVAAIQGLAALKSPRTGALALAAAQSADFGLQRAAGRVIGSLPAAELAPVRTAWPKLAGAAQAAVLAAWSDQKTAAALPVALDALKSEDPDVRTAAIQAAASIGGAKSVPALAQLAAGGGQGQAARETLARLGGPGVEAALLNEVNSGSPQVRRALLGVLADRPTPAAVSAMMTAASAQDEGVSVAALRALGRVSTAENAPRIADIMVRTPSDSARDAAQGAFVAIAQRSGNRDQAAQTLLNVMPNATGEGRSAVLTALAEVGGEPALMELTRAAASPDAGTKAAAVNALANSWSDTRPMNTLLEIAKNDQDRSLRVIALRGYLRLAGADDRASAETRLARVRTALAAAQRPEEKRQALGILRDIRLPESVEIAATYLDDEALVTEAADAILYLAAPQKRNNQDLAAVRGGFTSSALDKVIRVSKDESVKEQARKLR